MVLVIHANRFPDDFRIRAETAAPEAVAEDHFAAGARLVFSRLEGAPRGPGRTPAIS